MDWHHEMSITQNQKTMELIVTSPEKIQELVNQAVSQAVSEVLPKVYRQMYKKPVYSNDEVCDLLKVSKRHLQYLRDTEQITFIQNGRKILYRAEDLEAFFNANQINAEVGNV